MSLYRRGKTWWYSFRFAGQAICESAKTHSKVVARDAERARRRELEGTWNRIEKRTMPPNFSKAAQDWLESVTVCPATKQTYTFSLQHVTRYFGGMLVCDISARDIAAYQERRTSAGAGAATVNKEVVCLGSILRACGVWHLIKKSKNDVRLLEEPESRGRALESEQEQKLLAAASRIGSGEHHQGHWSPVYTVTALGLNTGMRHSEIDTLPPMVTGRLERPRAGSRQVQDEGRERALRAAESAGVGRARHLGRAVPGAKAGPFRFPRL